MITVEVDLHEVKNGKITKLKYEDTIFLSMDSISKPNDMKGKVIDVVGTQRIYENILKMVEEVMSRQKWENKDIRTVLKKFFPDNKRDSLDTKVCIYKKFINREQLHSKRTDIYTKCMMTDELDTYYKYKEQGRGYESWNKEDRIRILSKYRELERKDVNNKGENKTD